MLRVVTGSNNSDSHIPPDSHFLSMNFGMAWPEPRLVARRVASRGQIPQTVTVFQNFIRVTYIGVLTPPSLSFPVRMNSCWGLRLVGHVHGIIGSKFKWTASTIHPISDKVDTGGRELWSVTSWELPICLALRRMGPVLCFPISGSLQLLTSPPENF